VVSVVVSWRDRHELATALPSLVSEVRELGGDLTIVNFGGSIELLRQQIGPHADEVWIVQTQQQPYFNKSCAQNLGAARTEQPLIFFCDCDIILHTGTLKHLTREVQKRDGAFATLAKVTESEINSRQGKHVVCFGYELRIRTADGRQLCITDNEEDATDGSRQAPGLLLVRRADFLSINGYNSRLHGWGWEDQDMIARLTLGAGLERISDGSAVHLSHDDLARVANYPLSNRWESRDKMFRQALNNYDNADFQGTFRTDAQIQARRISGPVFCQTDHY
jgi:hypothetical protein